MEEPDPWAMKFLAVAIVAICLGAAIVAIIQAIVKAIIP
jgi:hypothetical protein